MFRIIAIALFSLSSLTAAAPHVTKVAPRAMANCCATMGCCPAGCCGDTCCKMCPSCCTDCDNADCGK